MLTNKARWMQDSEGVWLSFLVSRQDAAETLDGIQEGKTYSVTVKEHRERRSLDANALYWELCGRLARSLNKPPNEIYRQHIKDLGNYEVLCVLDSAVGDFSKHWCSNHIGRFVEERVSKISGCTTLLAYYGSSDFDKSQMSRLIDNCIQDCKSVGVETWPEDKVLALKEAWNG